MCQKDVYHELKGVKGRDTTSRVMGKWWKNQKLVKIGGAKGTKTLSLKWGFLRAKNVTNHKGHGGGPHHGGEKGSWKSKMWV